MEFLPAGRRPYVPGTRDIRTRRMESIGVFYLEQQSGSMDSILQVRMSP
jgi:hypothetical protein